MSIIDCSTCNIMSTVNLKKLIRIYSTWIYIILILISLPSLITTIIDGKEFGHNQTCSTKEYIYILVAFSLIFIINLTGFLFNIFYKRMNKRFYYFTTLFFSLLCVVVLILFLKQMLSYD